MFMHYNYKKYDYFLAALTIMLSIIGIFAIGSADYTLRSKQVVGVIFGIIIMITISLINYSSVLKYYQLYYVLSVFLLFLVLVMGDSANGSQRWFTIFGKTFQPSEAAKILLILFFSQFIMKYKSKIKTTKFLIVSCILVLPILLLVYKEPDLSTTIMFAIIFAIMMFAAGINWKIVATIIAVSVPASILFIYDAIQPDPIFLKEYQQSRILAWLHPEDYANSVAYQTLNSMMAIGSGQLQGKGYNTNEITSVLNGGFISESQTDFIFTVIGEEFGFIGSIIVVALLFSISMRCIWIAKNAKDKAGSIIATGVGAWIGFQGFMNIGVATGLLPNTGIPLPLVSSGLSSLMSVFMGIGFVLNVKLQGKRY